MADKDEILAAIAALGDRLEARIDVIANGVGRIESELATVKHDVLQIRVDLAAHRMQSDARLTALEGRAS